MSLSTKLLLLIPIICIVLLIFLIISNIYNELTNNSIKKYFYIKHPFKSFTILVLLFFISIAISIDIAMDDICEETILEDTSPNNKFDIKVQSSSFFDFGSGIIVYVEDNNKHNRKLENLLEYNIAQDLASIGSENISIRWDNNIAILIVCGEVETLYIDIWMDSNTNKFKYKLDSIKNSDLTFLPTTSYIS